jgi:putative peptidoglycan lipid II flippase
MVVLLAAGAVAAYLLLHGTGSGSPGRAHAGGAGGAAIHLSGIRAWDPYGTNGENDARAHYATDSSPTTYWETEQYYDAPSLDKPGVGLVLDAGRSVQLHRLGFSTSTPGLTAEIRAGDSSGGPFPTVVGASQMVGGQAQYAISGGPYRYYVIWITRLGRGYQTARINDVKAN